MTTGTEGPDQLYNETINDVVDALGGDDIIGIRVYPGAFGSALVNGGAGFDILRFTEAWNLSSSEPGRLVLRGGAGASMIVNYSGIERLEFTARYFTDQLLVFGDTQDWITFQSTGGAPVKVETRGGDDRVYLTGIHTGGQIDVGDGNDLVDLSGSSPTNNPVFEVFGRAGDDVLIGSSIPDSLQGGDGDDILDGRQGGDAMNGGAGRDTFFVDGADLIGFIPGETDAAVYARTSFLLPPDYRVDLFAAVDPSATDLIHLTGNNLDNRIQGNEGGNRLLGEEGNDYLIGLGGLDVLDGGAGNDTLVGGTGNDHYYVDAGDTIVELANEGTDIAFARTSYTLGAGVHVDLLAAISGIATDPMDLTGNELNNSIQGNDGDNFLLGLAGYDYLIGRGGNDQLDGGADPDILDGGAGNDRYLVDGGDRIAEAANEGYDIAYARSSYLLAPGSHVEFLAAIDGSSTAPMDLTGNELDNSIQGNNGDNWIAGAGGSDYLVGLGGNDLLDGGAGTDILVGGTGDDRYLVGSGDTVVEASGEGNDSVYALSSYVLTAGQHVEFLAAFNGGGTDALDLTGNELNNVIQGNAGANVLLGAAGSDYLIGLGGADTLDGGEGQDFLVGGAGADVFRFTSVSHSPLGLADTISDFESGIDKIDLSAIDADSTTAGDQAFTFLGSGAFTNHAGELRYEQIGGQFHIFGDVDGNGSADLHIVAYAPALTASDFIL
jgi:Ca2+-binding RTX toxin-like protein